jgi:DNA helicase-2/ATP-dependent DNA helicase PcrA
MMRSRYSSICPSCKERISIGDWIKKRKKGWMHRSCTPTVAEKPQRPSFPPSEHQQKILDWVISGSGHGMVEACPGSGKTSTLEHIVHTIKEAKPRSKIKVLAFNNPIAAEVGGKLGSLADVSTFHQWGLGMLKQRHPKMQISQNSKLWSLMKMIFPLKDNSTKEEKKLAYKKRRAYSKVIQMCKATLKTPEYCINRFGIDVNDIEFKSSFIPDLLKIISRDVSKCDYDDMVWMAHDKDCKQTKWDWILVDETQDLNPVMVQLLLKSVTSKTRIIAVGDRYQSIYAWRGADHHMMTRMYERFDATLFKLPVTYRCPTSHVDFIKDQLPEIDIKAAPNASTGEILHYKYEDIHEILTPKHNIICRKTAPLVRLAYELIKIGRPATVLGKDIGLNLINKVDEVGGNLSVQTLIRSLEELAFDKMQRLQEDGNEYIDQIMSDFHDKVDAIKIISEGCVDSDEVKAKIRKLFKDKASNIPLCTIHRCKGQTYKNTVLLEIDQMPMYREDADEAQQERNCYLVALSRSNDKLFLVDSVGKD